MTRRGFLKQLHCALFSALLLGALPAIPVQAQKNPKAEQKQSGLTAQQAASRAKAKHGGKVLKVTRQGQGYQVKLLLDSGKVTTVRVQD